MVRFLGLANSRKETKRRKDSNVQDTAQKVCCGYAHLRNHVFKLLHYLFVQFCVLSRSLNSWALKAFAKSFLSSNAFSSINQFCSITFGAVIAKVSGR